jgi:hypothetical protein
MCVIWISTQQQEGTEMSEVRGKSPYARKQKTPFRYSSEFEAWRSNPCTQTAMAHARMLLRVFGHRYWLDEKGHPLLVTDRNK